MLSTAELQEATAVIDAGYPRDTSIDREERARLIKVYKDDTKAAEAEWAVWLHAEYLDGFNDEVAEKVFTKAWGAGHSSGYNEVEYHYNELAELLNSVKGSL